MTRTKNAHGVTFTKSGFVDKNQYLFAVNPGLDQEDALNSVSDMLDTIIDPITDAGMGEALKDNSAWLVLHTLVSAKAVIDSLLLDMGDAK